ncbi:PD40 domain-containing protein [Leptospira haakeii]|uniref:Translocation protein TolB n=1 Tax=Leptospira haakeii TaxID=2023198 RepID=A0ABX4PJN9_9LEPT|nr:PD40 domain-containing protein [Leptospira haakeii]PKA14902.1 translocation protein TolB [Leptospira haakeii]PKA20447.1 translocation protein TolB [Leptospira haakeii]
MKHWVLFFFLCLFGNCLVFIPVQKVKPIEFDYGPISKNYFNPENDKPFPLTVQRGNNLYNSTTKDGRYLFYTTGQKGNYDIWFRDLKSSIVVPITEHPSSEYKPAISPDGKKLAFVSEKYDTAGDIVLLEIEPEVWAKNILEGKRFLNDDFEFITNPEYSDISKSDRFSDSDPIWGKDSRVLLFSSDRLTPGTPNLILWDTEGKEKPILLTQSGAVNPYWSQDGKSIVYLSYADSKEGEIYSLDLATRITKRLTNDPYLDFSPSLSSDGRYLFYTSIRSDSDGNRKLDERDNSLIIRLDLSDMKERRLTSGNFSLFDTKYSSFNGGSILFTASYYGTLNIYFLPLSGSIPKASDISAQFELAKEYGKKQSLDDYLLALDSLELYYKEDPLYPIFRAKVLNEKYSLYKKSGKTSEIKKEMSASRLDPKWGLAYVYYLESENKGISEIKEYFSNIRNIADAQVAASILEEIGNLEERSGKIEASLNSKQELVTRFPGYYNIHEILRNIGALQLKEAKKKDWTIPSTLLQAANESESKTIELRNLYGLFEEQIFAGKSDSEKISLSEKIESSNKIRERSPVLYRFLMYTKAAGLSGQGAFAGSNSLLEPLLKEITSKDPLFLKIHLLRSSNFKGLGSVRYSLESLRTFLENYDHDSGVEISDKEMERFFIYFENLARNYENRSDFFQASLHYFYNTENMFLAKSKNLFQDTVYKDYAIYYQKLMVDTSFKLARSISEKNASSILGNLNPLEFDPLDKKEGLVYIDQYFEKEKILPRARAFLDLATLYGYAYYLINRSVIRETFYYNSGTMDRIKKEAALRDFKQAEYELRWIIFAEPTYHDAYQLLGWLYQYVDIMKSRKPNDKEPTDEDKYKDVYSKYFPEKNFEENIELYSQILELLGENFPNKKALSDLRLNLGNNYFLLKNYPKADEQYSLVESYSNYIISKAQFEDYRQKAVFLFNSARASMYMSKYGDAVRKLKNASDIYSKNEFLQLYSGTDYTKNLQSYREKLTLLRTLTGLSHMELGEYALALPYLTEALELNEPSRLVDPINIRNALAISYQKLGYISKSEENLKEAEKLAASRTTLWLPKKVSPKFWESVWDSIWDFVFETVLPDSVRISGSGRFPEAIPPVFQPLLSSGIRVNNLVLEQNYRLAAEETDKRLEYVSKKGLKKTLAGQLVQSQSYADLGFFQYKRNEFEKAKLAFLEENEFLKDTANLSGRTTGSFKRYLYSLFASIEASDKKDKAVYSEELNKALEELDRFKRESIENCLSSWSEDLLEGNSVCSEGFYKQYYDYDILKATVLYYSGEENFKKGEWLEGFEKLGISSSLLETPSGLPKEIVGLSKDPFPRKERVFHFLSRASVFYRLGDLEKAEECLKAAEEMANVFYFGAELIQTWVLQARLDLISKKPDKAKVKLSKAEDLLKKQFHLISDNKSFLLRDLYETKIRAELDSGNTNTAFNDWIRLQRLLNFRNFQKGNWEFREARAEYVKFESDWKNYRNTYFKYQNALETRGDVKKEEIALSQSGAQVSKSLEVLRSKFPKRTAFLDPFGAVSEEVLNQNETEIRLLESRGSVFAKVRNFSSIKFLNFENESKAEIWIKSNFENSGRNLLLDPGNTSIGELLGSQIPGINFKLSSSVSNREEGTPKVISSFLPIGGWNYRKVDSDSWIDILEDTDVLVSPFPDVKGDSTFGERKKGTLELRELFSREHRLGAVIFTYSEKPNWRQILKVYTGLSGSGVNLMYVCPGETCVKESLGEIITGKVSNSAIRFGRLPERSGNRNVEAERLFVKSRKDERISDSSEVFSDLHKARSYTESNSNLALKIESDLLRAYQRLKPDFSLGKIFSLRYENRDLNSQKELGLNLCLSRLLETEYKDCAEIPLPEAKNEILNGIFALKEGKFPGTSLNSNISADKYDPFLFRLKLSNLALEAYYPDLAISQLGLAKQFISSGSDLEVWKKMEARIRKEKVLLEEEEDWSENSNQIELDPQERNYPRHLAFLENRKKLGHRISPLSLYSEIHSSSKTLFQSLDSESRSSVLDLLRYSLSEETGKEMEEFLNSFVDLEGFKKNFPRQARIMLEFSKAYLSRGDYDKAKYWISKSKGISDELYSTEIEFINSKISYLEGKKPAKISESGFSEYLSEYENASTKKSSEFVELTNRFVKHRKKKKFSSSERRELNDFITYLQTLSFQQNDSETFFDLGLIKDKVSAVRSALFGRSVSYSDLPNFNKISFALEEKIPENQEFLALMDLGLKTFYIKFTKGKSKGDLAFKDNRKLRASIYKYNEEADKGGAEVLLREALETEIRQNIRPSKNKTTYLYLSSYHFLAPILPKADEEIYYVADPETLLKNPIHKEKDEFWDGFGIITKDDSNSPSWYSQLLHLENLELFPKGNPSITPFHVVRVPLMEDREKGILFGNKSVSEVEPGTLQGVWILASSFLEGLGNASLSLRDSLYYLGKFWKGPGIVNLGFQTDTHNSRFLKEISSRKEDSKTSLRSRFLKTMDTMREVYPVDKYWNGYRLFTTSFISKE